MKLKRFVCDLVSLHLYQDEVNKLGLEAAFSKYEGKPKRLEELFVEALNRETFTLPDAYTQLEIKCFELETANKFNYDDFPRANYVPKPMNKNSPPYITWSTIFRINEFRALKNRIERLTLQIHMFSDALELANKTERWGNTCVENVRQSVLNELNKLDEPTENSVRVKIPR